MSSETALAPVSQLEAQLLQLWKKFLEKSDLTIDDDFFESGGDSIMATELFFEIERLLQDTIPPSILFETGTVRQLAERLCANITAQPGVKIGGNNGRMFHFFHGDFNYGGVSVRKLQTMLGPGRSILAVAPHGMDDESLPASIEQMAAERLPLILEAQPHGPYVLGGHCNGAVVAFEVARLLIKAGHTVDLVVMIDPVAVGRSAQIVLRVLGWVQRAAGRSAMQCQNTRIRTWTRLAKAEQRSRRAQSKKGKGTHSTDLAPAKSAQPQKKPVQVERLNAYARVLSNYRPSPLEVPILYVALSYSGYQWRRISSQMEFVDIPGQHRPGASIWERVRSRLEALDASNS